MDDGYSLGQGGDPLDMIVVMGVTGAGKSYFINKMAGRSIVAVGDDLNPCTQRCEAVPITIGNSKILLIDTPGFDDSERTDSDILMEITRLLTFQYKAGVRLKGAIYLHRITDVRYARTGVKTLKIFNKICGEGALKNVLLVTTRWNELDESKGADREKQLRQQFWQFMLSKGSTMTRFHGTRESATTVASLLLVKDTVVLAVQRELVDEGKTLGQTAAGAFVSDDLEELKRNHEEEIAALRAVRDTLKDDERQTRKQLEIAWAEEDRRMERAKEDEANLRRNVAAEVRAEVEAEIKKKKSKGQVLRSVLPFIPSVLSIIELFVGIPPGTSATIMSWFGGDFGN